MEFFKSNAGKLTVVAVLFVVAIVLLVVRGGGGEPSRSGKAEFVCVATGKTFWLDRQPRIFPFANPDTGEATLLPCGEDENGEIHVSSRCRELVQQLEREGINKYIDPETLRVRTEP